MPIPYPRFADLCGEAQGTRLQVVRRAAGARRPIASAEFARLPSAEHLPTGSGAVYSPFEQRHGCPAELLLLECNCGSLLVLSRAQFHHRRARSASDPYHPDPAGKGGGLIGAFGGAGGSSPFGSKAGDTFTRITLTMAGIWVLLIMIHIKVVKNGQPQQEKKTTQAISTTRVT